MTDKYLNKTGVEILWSKIKNQFVRKPSGLDGQILTQNSNEITSENPIQLLNMVNTEEELENALSSTPLTLRDVFDTWYRFAHDTNYTQNNLSSSGTQAALDAWYFDSSKNAIGNTVNTVPYVGFVSEKTYKNWRIKTKGVGTDSDDDFMSIIVAFMTDSAGVEHTLSVIRSGAHSNGFLGSGDSYAFALVLDFQNNWSNPKILAGIRKSELTGSPWSAGAHIEVTRNGNTIVAKTSQFGSDVLDKTFTYSMPTSQGSLSVTDYTNIRLMLGGKAKIGFGMCSQPGYFVLEETDGIFDNTDVYDVIHNKVYSYDGGWTEKGTVSGNVLNLSRVYNEKTDKLFYYKDEDAILLNAGTSGSSADLSDYVTKADLEYWQANRLKPGSVVFTINPSEWQNGACVKNVGVDAKYYCSLGVPVSTDTTNLANVSNANIIITEHSGNNMTFKCLGSVPTSAITLELTVFYYDVIDKNADYFNITDAEIDAIFG